MWAMHVLYPQHHMSDQVEYVGGDKAAEDLKDPKSNEIAEYIRALRDLCKSVSICHFLGMTPEDFCGK